MEKMFLPLAIFFAFPAYAESPFITQLRNSLSHSALSPEEKVQHLFNRLSYGQNPAKFGYENVIRRNSAGTIILSTTHQQIENFLVASLDRRAQTSPAIEGMLATSGVVYADLDGQEVEAQWRQLFSTLDSYNEELSALKRAISILENRSEPVPPEMIARKVELENLIAVEKTKPMFMGWSGKTQRAIVIRQIAYALFEDHPLLEILQEFWFNHFNVFMGKAMLDISSYREMIGRKMYLPFSELLMNTAKHPAMGLYLDNGKNFTRWKTVNGVTTITRVPNENYAREVMELHTLGIGPQTPSNPTSPYSQEDVSQAALLLSGWNLAGIYAHHPGPRRFAFVQSNQVPLPKAILGRIYGNGRKPGENFIHHLAQHPLTAKNVSKKLVRRFVTENEASVEYQSLQPVIEQLIYDNAPLFEVYQEIFSSPAFWSREAYRSKVKTPFQMAVSVARSGGIQPTASAVAKMEEIRLLMKSLGHPLQFCIPPTGYSTDSADLVGTHSILSSISFAFKSAGSLADTTSSFHQSYLSRESLARYSDAPGRLGHLAFQSLFQSSALTPRFGLSAADVAFSGNLEDAAEDFADRVSNSPRPVRTIHGLVTGSAGFQLY